MAKNFLDKIRLGSRLSFWSSSAAELRGPQGHGIGTFFLGSSLVVSHLSDDESEVEPDCIGIRGVCPTGWPRPLGEYSARVIADAWRGRLHALDEARASLDLSFRALMLYDAIIQNKGFTRVGSDIYMAPQEIFSGNLLGEIQQSELGWELVEGSVTLDLVSQELGLGEIFALSSNLKAIPLRLSAEPEKVGDCPQELSTDIRTITIRPVFFLYDQDDHVTGSSLQSQVDAARRIWEKCCIYLDVLEPKKIVDKDRNKSNNPEFIASGFDDKPNIIEVYMVNGDVPTGGVTLGYGQSQAKVVITEKNLTNNNLLAHELGHVLNGDHPGSTTDPRLWTADWGTVLQPSCPPGGLNPDKNTLCNCRRACNPAAVPSGAVGGCCMFPDLIIISPAAGELGAVSRPWDHGE